MCIEKAKHRPVCKQNFKKYMDSICAGFKQLGEAHKVCDLWTFRESWGKVWPRRSRGVHRGWEMSKYTSLNYPHRAHIQSVFQSQDHQRGNVWLAERRRISKEERKLQIFKEHVQSQQAGIEMSFKLNQVFTFDSQRCFNAVNLLLTKKVTESLSWIKGYEIRDSFASITVTKSLSLH